jgi:hypothetical protein
MWPRPPVDHNQDNEVRPDEEFPAMNDEHTDASGTMSSSRLAQFEAEVAKLKVTGGGANPERLGSRWGIGLTILGFVIAIISWWSALDGKDALSVLRAEIFAIIGVGISIVGIVIWVRNSLTRYMRYWIIRLVYEQREQTEQLIQALRDQK